MFVFYYEFFAGRLSDPVYREAVFQPVALATLLVCLLTALFFYRGLGYWRPGFHRRFHWFVTLGAVMLAAYGAAVWYAGRATGNTATDGPMFGFALGNLLLAAVSFFLFSLACRKLSVHARHTPF